MDGRRRKNVKPGQVVEIVQKKDQHTGKVVKGEVKDILTNSKYHPHGIKVRLSSGRIGRIKQIKD